MNKIKKIIANRTLTGQQLYVGAENIDVYIIKGKEYEIYSEFLTEKMYSGKCYVVLCENGKFIGLDSEYFDQKK